MNKTSIGIGVAVVGALALAAYFFLGRTPEAPAPEASGQAATTESAAPAPAAGDLPALYEDDHVMGRPEAPVTMIEYSSLTCPHCATFSNDVLPRLKTDYIDKGLVRLVYRDFPLNRPALDAALLASCVDPARYFSMIDVLFRTQDTWTGLENPQVGLRQIGRTAGLDEARMDACLADQAVTERIVARTQEAQQRWNIDSTPTFVINGAVHRGALAYDAYVEILKPLLP
jgi:protein-disulfide isomerase